MPLESDKGAIIDARPDPSWVVNFTNVEVLNFTDPDTAKYYPYLAYNAHLNTMDNNFIPVAGNVTSFG